jgi:pSer/pThr/pTyr-binding forkhead associated (FHA) protein
MKITLITPASRSDIEEIQIEHYPFVLGRGPRNDFVLKFAFISRQHCQFILRHDQVFIQDLESYNGTFLNGRRIDRPAAIRPGDEVGLGPLCFRVAGPNAQVATVADVGVEPTLQIVPSVGDEPLRSEPVKDRLRAPDPAIGS